MFCNQLHRGRMYWMKSLLKQDSNIGVVFSRCVEDSSNGILCECVGFKRKLFYSLPYILSNLLIESNLRGTIATTPLTWWLHFKDLIYLYKSTTSTFPLWLPNIYETLISASRFWFRCLLWFEWCCLSSLFLFGRFCQPVYFLLSCFRLEWAAVSLRLFPACRHFHKHCSISASELLWRWIHECPNTRLQRCSDSARFSCTLGKVKVQSHEGGWILELY